MSHGTKFPSFCVELLNLDMKITVIPGSQINQIMNSKRRTEKRKEMKEKEWKRRVMLNTVVAGMDTVTV